MELNSVNRKVIKFSYLDLDGAIQYWEGKDSLSVEEQELLGAYRATCKDLVNQFSFVKEEDND